MVPNDPSKRKEEDLSWVEWIFAVAIVGLAVSLVFYTGIALWI
jgi:hypothetical protein